MLTINLKSGRRIIVDRDEYAQNPRDAFEHGCRLLVVSNRYFSGDENLSTSEISEKAAAAKKAGDHVLNVYALVHSGYMLSFNPFGYEPDSATCGVIIVPADVPEERARQFAEREIEELNQYLAGGVYCARVESPDGFCGAADDCVCGIYADSAKDASARAAIGLLDLTDDERLAALD